MAVHANPQKNYYFGDKGEAETIRAMNERIKKGEPAQICSKGVYRCSKTITKIHPVKKANDRAKTLTANGSEASLTQDDVSIEAKKSKLQKKERKVGKSVGRNHEEMTVPPGIKIRRFSNTNCDISLSMTDFKRYSERIPFYKQMHLDVNEKRFEHFNYFPVIASKYPTPLGPDFAKYLYRGDPKGDRKRADDA
jgi:hypothetical protein